MRVLHLSDVHLQIDWSTRSYLSMGVRRTIAQLEMQGMGRARKYERAGEVVRRIVAAAAEARADHVILSGDLTALADDEEFRAAREALSPLAGDPAKLTVIPGNHDLYTPGAARDRRFSRWFGEHEEGELPDLAVEGAYPLVRLVGDALAVVAISTAHVPPLPGIAAGHVGAPQLPALAKVLAHGRLRGRAVYVVVHHAPLRWDGTPDRATHGLTDGASLLRVCREHRVAAILCGHVHHRYTVDAGGGLTVVNAGSSTAKGREGYWLLEDEGGTLARATPVAVPLAS